MTKLFIACLWVGILLCLSHTPVMAQDEELTVPYCGVLTVEECNALDATAENMANLTSGTSESVMEIYLTNGPLRDREISLQISSQYTFVISPDILARLNELRAMTPEAIQADRAAAVELLLLPLRIDTDDTITVAFSPALLAILSARFNTDIPATLSFHTRMIDSVAYIRLADFAAFGTQPAWLPEWIGIELTTMLSDTIANEVADPEFDVQAAQAELEAPGMALASSVVYHVPPEQIAAYADFMHLVSLDTAEMDGQAVNRYHLSWDIPRYLGGPLFADQIGLPVGPNHPNPTSFLLGMLSSILLHGLRAEVTQIVGAEDGYLYQVETRIQWDIAVAGGPPRAESPTLGITSTTINHDLNMAESIPVPEKAVVPPLNLIIQTFKFINR